MGMTNEEIIKGLQAVNEHIGKHFNEGGAWMAEFIDNAIKALEQTELNPSYNGVKTELEPCEDCISRKDAIKHFEDNIIEVWSKEEIVEELTYELPSVTTQQTKWIPCSERLPECHEEVLVTCADEVGIAWYREFGHWLSNDFGNTWLELNPPIAWMPLPQPYKAECEEV